MDEGGAAVSIRDRLLKERHALLDLSTRNRLLNTPLRTRNNRAIEIVDEKAPEVFRLLISSRALSFLPGIELSEEERAALDPDDDITGGIPQPDDNEVDDRGIAVRHADLRLQTRLTSEGLQKRLFDIWYDAQTIEQEQGVNVLFLALGLLRWFDSESSDVARHAPLVLLPVKVERNSAADRFKLLWREEAPSPNLTLQAKMKVEFGLTLEDFRDEDELDLDGYCARVAETVSLKQRWEVLPNAIVLGFFSFSKFLMYRDLDPEIWPAELRLDAHPLVTALLRDGFPESAPLVDEAQAIDDVLPPIEQHHVVDADSSQTVAIAEAARGRNLVVKGPPGTGKSQTITNIIAAAVARGKKVLFVAEKMAALDVVHRRLQQVGLGPLTLQLHSNKASKRVVLEELKRTRDAQIRSMRSDPTIVQKLSDTSGTLNAFARRLHTPLQPSGLTPHTILGHLARASATADQAVLALSGAEAWNQQAVVQRRAELADLAQRLATIGPAPQHPWRGVQRGPIDPVERAKLGREIDELSTLLAIVRDLAEVPVRQLEAPAPETIGDLQTAASFLAIVPLPDRVDLSALGSPIWKEAGLSSARAAVDTGRSYSAVWNEIEKKFNEVGQRADLSELRTTIVTKGASLFRFFSGQYRAHMALFRSYLREPLPKRQHDRVALLDEIINAQSAKAEFARAKSAGLAFGQVWMEESSDWDALEKIVNWRSQHSHLPATVWTRLRPRQG